MDGSECADAVTETGPILHFRGLSNGRVSLAAIVVRAEGTDPGRLTTEAGEVEGQPIWTRVGLVAWRYVFDLPARDDAWYEWGGTRHELRLHLSGDLRIAFASCNGQEHGDLDRDVEKRNRLWTRMAADHAEGGLSLILQGGDQIYADEVLEAHPASRNWPESVPDHVDDPDGLASALRDAFFRRYVELFGQAGFADVMARVPSLSIWDDHDICDGWGSRPPELLDSVVGQSLFAAARDAFLVFQCATAPDEVPPLCLDRTGLSLGWHAALPGLSVVAPDLRSERRPHRQMGETGWQAFTSAVESSAGDLILVVSSVPALGPRLSLIEKYMGWTPWVEKYQDDLRDQWQSRAHREEWRRFLTTLIAAHEREDTAVVVVSGEIHLAARGTMATGAGPLHQLVASGIAHPPPPGAYAAVLGTLARLGEAPLDGHPIRMHPLPGRPRIYTAERNYLVIERREGTWQAIWQLEEAGATPALAIA